MIEIQVPGYKTFCFEHLVLDYNGTLAFDGELIAGVRETLNRLAGLLQVHIITADTFGQVRQQLEGIPCTLSILPPDDQVEAKRAYVQQLGPGRTASIGNGRNDRLMLRAAALGIAVVLAEGASPETLASARVVTGSITDALDLLIHPLRLIATLRS